MSALADAATEAHGQNTGQAFHRVANADRHA